MSVIVIVPASGEGARFSATRQSTPQSTKPKQFVEISGRHILHHTLAALAKAEIVDKIIVTVPEGFLETVSNYGVAKVTSIVEGGGNRTESVRRALQVLPQDAEIVLIHDGVRPLVDECVINDVVAAVREHGAAVACTPVTNTIKRANGNNVIEETLDRSVLWQAQTPQGFTYEIILNAYENNQDKVATDDSSLVEQLGIPVVIVPDKRSNIKITTVEDLAVVETLLKHSENQSPPAVTPTDGRVLIYTDGACSGNPGPGGYGVVLQYGNHRKELSGGEPATTNNRMEIMGVIKGLETLKEPCEVAIYSDSRYVVDAIEKGWAVRWRQNNWMRNKKEPALNPDLWETLLVLLQKHKVTFHWVKGHAGHLENERCDELAREAIIT